MFLFLIVCFDREVGLEGRWLVLGKVDFVVRFLVFLSSEVEVVEKVGIVESNRFGFRF